MGNLVEPEKVQAYNFMSNYKFKEAVNNAKFGENTKLYNEKTSKTLLYIKEINLEDDVSLNYYKNLLKNSKFNTDIFITKECIFLNKDSNLLCQIACNVGNIDRLVVSMEYNEDSLLTEITERKKNQFYYEEAEIWYMLERLIIMEKYLVGTFNRVHGNLKPDAIFITDDENIKFIDPTIVDYKIDGLTKTKLGLENFPLSPELMHLMRYNIEDDYDRQASEVWTIGIIL